MPHRFKKAPDTEARFKIPVDPELLDAITRRYADTNAAFRARLEEQFSLTLHDIRMGGVWKRTSPRRLPATEDAILGLVAIEYQADCRVLDIGASDGSTAVDLLERLRARWGPGVSAVMSDINFWLERYQLGPLIEYRAANGEQVFVRIGRWRLRTAKLTRVEPVSPVKRIFRRLHRAVGRVYERAWSPIERRMRYAGRISLINPRANACHGLEPRVLDCLVLDDSLLQAFHVARASNVLNLDYFSRDELIVALASVHAYLKEGGCLVISRSEGNAGEETEHGSAWTKAGERFAFGNSFGRGSEIKGLVDSFRAE